MIGWVLRQLLGRKRDRPPVDPVEKKRDRAIWAALVVFLLALGLSGQVSDHPDDIWGPRLMISFGFAYVVFSLCKPRLS